MSTAALLTQPPTTAALLDTDDGFSLRLQRKPEAIVAEARMCADALIAAVKRNGWAQAFGSRDHLYFEAWAFLAAMYRVTPRTRETRLVQIGDVTGYEAFAEAFHVPSGIVIGAADSMCLDDEDNWSSRPTYEWDQRTRKRIQTGERPVPLFQLRSMAQTRAMARALKGPFSWIIAMAGYAPTAAEDMTPTQAQPRQPQQRQEPVETAAAPAPAQQPASAQEQRQEPVQPASNGNGGGNGNGGAATITAKQASRLWALGFSGGVSKQIVGQILKGRGYDRAEQVRVEDYDGICADIENAGAGSAN